MKMLQNLKGNFDVFKDISMAVVRKFYFYER